MICCPWAVITGGDMPDLSELKYKLPVAPLAIIALEGARQLAEDIDKSLVARRKEGENKFVSEPAMRGYSRDTYLTKARCPRFGSGEAKGILDESVRGKDLFIIADVANRSITYRMNGFVNHMSPDDHYQDLKRIIAAAAGRAKRVNVIMPFLYEGRQHKRSSRESLDCAYMLEELISMGVDNFITFDAHDPRVANAIPLSDFDNYTPPTPFIRALLHTERDLTIDKEHLVVISPDEGALDRSIYFANVLGVNAGMFYKRRDYTQVVNGKNPIVAHEFLGDSIDGKDALIMDDMISSGESIIDTARQLKAMNAKRVYLCCTFGLFTNGLKLFDNAYERCWFEKVVTTNLTYLPPELKSKPYFAEADMSEFVADIIHMMNHDASMSNVMDTSEQLHRAIENYNNRCFEELDEHA